LTIHAETSESAAVPKKAANSKSVARSMKSKAGPAKATHPPSAKRVRLPPDNLANRTASQIAILATQSGSNLPALTTSGSWKPTRDQQLAAVRKRVPDLIAPNLTVLFCGINPGLYSAAVGHHFAGPGNLFYPTLHATGFTPSLLTAFDEPELLRLGYGVTNLVTRPTAGAEDIEKAELVRGARALRRKVLEYKPRFVAVLGLIAYRQGFENNKAAVGRQLETIGSTVVWLLPNPSGLNAFHQPAILNQMFSEFRQAVVAAPVE
jgi:TDG/mug DNA glycosylase family protein